MIVAGAELAQTEPVVRKRRDIAQDFFDSLELGFRDFAHRRQVDQNPDPRFLPEGNTHAQAEIGFAQRLAIGDPVIEKPVQGNIKGDSGNLHARINFQVE